MNPSHLTLFVLERLLGRLGDANLASSIAGDLAQERHRHRSALWLFRTSVAMLAWLVMHRLNAAIRELAGGARRPGGMSDARRTARALLRAPWHAAAIAGVMALCVALGTTVLAIVDGVLFKPLDLPSADRLWVIEPRFKDLPPAEFPMGASAADLEQWTNAAPRVQFTGSRAQPWGGFGSGVNDAAAGGALVLPNFFDVIGVRPMRGGFTPADFETSQPFQPVVITYDIWLSRFGGDEAVIGRRVELDPTRKVGYRIAGIMPAGFRFPSERADVKFIGPIVIPAEASTDPRRRTVVEVIARVPPEVTPTSSARASKPGCVPSLRPSRISAHARQAGRTARGGAKVRLTRLSLSHCRNSSAGGRVRCLPRCLPA